jgi:hypothetical protein
MKMDASKRVSFTPEGYSISSVAVVATGARSWPLVCSSSITCSAFAMMTGCGSSAAAPTATSSLFFLLFLNNAMIECGIGAKMRSRRDYGPLEPHTPAEKGVTRSHGNRWRMGFRPKRIDGAGCSQVWAAYKKKKKILPKEEKTPTSHTTRTIERLDRRSSRRNNASDYGGTGLGFSLNRMWPRRRIGAHSAGVWRTPSLVPAHAAQGKLVCSSRALGPRGTRDWCRRPGLPTFRRNLTGAQIPRLVPIPG